MKYSLLFLLAAALLLSGVVYVFWGSAPAPPHITWGINFSKAQAEELGLDWRVAYRAMLEDLSVRTIKLLTRWDAVEPQPGVYDFDDTDWQLAQAADHQVGVIYVVGIKTGRWPECHIPAWVDISKEKAENEALDYISTVIGRYKANPAITHWQVENEPLFRFGTCPDWYYDGGALVRREVALVKSLDPSRPVIVSDSGEQSSWIPASRIGDIVGTTLYKRVWVRLSDRVGFYGSMFFPPKYYWLKAELVRRLSGKKVINVELQAEPWVNGSLADTALSEQEKTMSLAQLKTNVAFARRTGLDTFYFWGAEWWYWLKEKQNQPEIWNYAKTIIY